MTTINSEPIEISEELKRQFLTEPMSEAVREELKRNAKYRSRG